MLNIRTNILFDEKTYQYLIRLANKNNVSIGHLVRKAVDNVYFNRSEDEKITAFNAILNLKKQFSPISQEQIKKYLDYGRK